MASGSDMQDWDFQRTNFECFSVLFVFSTLIHSYFWSIQNMKKNFWLGTIPAP